MISLSDTKAITYIRYVDNKEITISEAVQRTGLSRYRIWKLVKAGRIEGRKVGPLWLVTTASVDHYLRHRQRPGGYRRKPAD